MKASITALRDEPPLEVVRPKGLLKMLQQMARCKDKLMMRVVRISQIP
jgi:hypothetical protein